MLKRFIIKIKMEQNIYIDMSYKLERSGTRIVKNINLRFKEV